MPVARYLRLDVRIAQPRKPQVARALVKASAL
jgi:hypothetical protein